MPRITSIRTPQDLAVAELYCGKNLADNLRKAVKAGSRVEHVQASFMDPDEYDEFRVDGKTVLHIRGF
jgi:hypothetical protein